MYNVQDYILHMLLLSTEKNRKGECWWICVLVVSILSL